MVQERLLQLVDTMADLIEKDHKRIRQLELEIARLRSVLDRYGIQVPREPVGESQPTYQPRPNVTGPSGSPAVPGEQLPRTDPTAPSVDIRGTVLPMPSPQAMSQYQTALQAFNEGRYSQSIDMLTELRRSDPNSVYAPNYEYWRGESFYALGQYERAIQSFTTVQTQFPGSAKSDDAEFKIAESYDKLGDRSRARLAYERLLAVHPDSEYRPRAETKLRRLR
ncbi:MAG TPA: tetratricopeptide repeat protein [Candidatus Kapabacteria bacterium]|jgi:tol-pal system protein YbgF|nr:tetratricopeptide repeat protein [Candidatus Kapabacteria bacterium]